MSETSPNLGGYRQRADGKPRVHVGGGVNPETRPNRTESPKAERKAAARALFEGQPGATCETVAAEVGVPVGTVRRWKAEGGWRPAVKKLPELSARAGALADSFKVKMSELGKPMDDEVAADEAAREVAVDFAVDVRAQVLDRHRKEWAAPRKIAYEAIQRSDFERAKLAKISAETLTLIQAGECRAYGIKPDDKGDGRTVVVVERDGVSDSGETSTSTDGGAA